MKELLRQNRLKTKVAAKTERVLLKCLPIVSLPYLWYGIYRKLTLMEALAMDITPYVLGNKERIKLEEKRRLNYYRKGCYAAKRIAKALREEYPYVEVYLIGSLTNDSFDLDSDIDIVVKRLPEEHFYKAYRIAEDIAEPIPIDFIQFEFAKESMQARIVRDGVRI